MTRLVLGAADAVVGTMSAARLTMSIKPRDHLDLRARPRTDVRPRRVPCAPNLVRPMRANYTA
jgi:hypothetical protein